MAFVPLTPEEIASSEPVKTTTLEKLRGNLDDHEYRIQIAEGSVSAYPAILMRVNGNYSNLGAMENVLKTTVNLNLSIIGVRLLVDKAGSSGITEVDIKVKRGEGEFTSIFNGNKPSASYSSGDNFLSDSGEIDQSRNILQPGDIIRLDQVSAQLNGQSYIVRIDWARSVGSGDPPSIDPKFSDKFFKIFNDDDITKAIDVDLSGVGTHQTRTITMPDSDVDLGDIQTTIESVLAVEQDVGQLLLDVEKLQTDVSTLENTVNNLQMNDLTDVNASAPSPGDTLVWDDEAQEYINAPMLGGVASVNGQNGVVILTSANIPYKTNSVEDELSSKDQIDGIGAFIETISNESGDDIILEPDTNKVILTNSDLNSIAGIKGSTGGSRLLIVNKTEGDVIIRHNFFVYDSGEAVSDIPINTGIGEDLTLLYNTSLLFSLTDPGTPEWTVVGGTGSGGVENLSDLDDVSIGTPADSEELVYSGDEGRWENRPGVNRGFVNHMRRNIDAIRWDDDSYFTITDNTSSPLSLPSDLKITCDSSDGNDKKIQVSTNVIPIEHRGKRTFVRFSAKCANYKYFSETEGWEIPELRIYDSTNEEYLFVYPLAGFVTDPNNASNKLGMWIDGDYHAYFDLPETTSQVFFELFYKYAPGGNESNYLSKNIVMTPDMPTLGSVITMPESWTPTGSWTTNTTYSGKKWRVGNRGYYEVKVALSGAPNTSPLRIDMPTGEVISFSDTVANDHRQDYGVGRVHDDGGLVYRAIVTGLSGDPSKVQILDFNSEANRVTYEVVNQSVPTTFANGDYVNISWSAPIVGWDTGPLLSNVSLSLKTTYVKASGNAGQAITTSSNIPFIGREDPHNQWSGSQFTPKESGWYAIDGGLFFTAGIGTRTRLFGTGFSVNMNMAINSNVHKFSTVQFLTAGIAYSVRTESAGGTLSNSAQYHFLNIVRLPDYQMFAAYNKYVGGKVYRDAAQTGINTNGSRIKLTYNKVDHTEGVTWDGTNNRWVIESPGRYQFGVSTSISSTNVVAGTWTVNRLYKDSGSTALDVVGDGQASAATTAIMMAGGVSSSIHLSVGESVEVNFFGSADNSLNTLSTSTSAADNYFWIRKVD